MIENLQPDMAHETELEKALHSTSELTLVESVRRLG